ncbi:hypothetical protein [Streptomyces sp. CA-179760]|uniref:hypothetical protein n=1 Tax=Streptomyces sp. CA-179760 TaxID=3240054 RepID=UPI003D925BBB
MRIRRMLALAAATAALTTGLAATPAAAGDNPGSGEVSAAAWTPTTTLSAAPIRKCYAATCDVVARTNAGDTVYWSHNAYNTHNNLWYYVEYTFGNGHPKTVHGWIYCGNVTAPC